MAAYPFRKMTTGMLRRLLKDEREQNWHLTEASEQSDSNPPACPVIRIQPIPSQPHEIPTESR